MSSTSVINVRKAQLVKAGYIGFADWASHPDHVYIGRNMEFKTNEHLKRAPEGAHFKLIRWRSPMNHTKIAL